MESLMILILVAAFLILIFFYLEHKNALNFESKGIPYVGNGTFRFILNFFKKIGFVENVTNQYSTLKAKNAKIGAAQDFGRVGLIIMDPELIKSVLVKDFDNFVDRRIFVMPKNDYLFAKMLIALKGEDWKQLRSKLSPTFTTGKIKRLFKLFDESGKKLVKFVEQEMATSQGEISMEVSYSKFTMDIIASAVCGMDSKAWTTRQPSLFERMGAKLQLNFGGSQIFKILIMLLSQRLTDMLGISFFEMEMQEFFMGAIKSSLHQRRENNEKRNDFIQLMMEASEDKLKVEDSELDTFEKDAIVKQKNSDGSNVAKTDPLDDVGIVANCVLFILAGYDTTQSLLLFCAYVLAINPEVQDKLRKEIDQVLDENDGELNYDSLHKMVYLDMVINETLRKFPAAGMTDRACTADYKIPGIDYVLKKGDGIVIPIMGLHHDEKYFPDPERFDPERFSPANKSKINPYTFLPFGQGPRNCIGMRFALTEVKVAISHLVHNFKIEPSKKTLIPMRFANTNSLKPEGGLFLALNKIS